jgi:putative PIG3 family NAD(P)H quinone oxidoreductase
MHAIVIQDKQLTWSEAPDPEPAEGEVVVEVTATAVNRADVLQRQGFYPPPKGAPPYPGLECSGVISALGPGVTGYHVGERVCALLAGGGYAERVVVPAGQLLPVPAGLSLVEAAALPEVACTVWSNVVDRDRLRPGETLLVHGGGSGIGTFAIQLGAALGASVLVTARAEKHERLRALGAHLAIDYQNQDFVRAVHDFTEGRGADVVLDIMGAKYLDRNIDALAVEGRITVIGMQGGRAAELDLGDLAAGAAAGRQGARREGCPGAGVAAGGGGSGETGHPHLVSAGRGGRGASAPGVERPLRQDSAAALITHTRTLCPISSGVRRVANADRRGKPSMDGHRIRPLGDTVTYAPHRSASTRAVVPQDDGPDEQSLRWKMRIWVGGGVVTALALIAFGVWAVATAERIVVAEPEAVSGGARAGNFRFAIGELRCGVESIGPDGLAQRPSGQFCLLDVTVTNIGTEPELFDSGAQRAYDTNGVAYAVADQAAVFLNDRNPTLLNEIAPGDAVQGVLPFDVPEDVQLTEVSVHGSMSTPGVRITLPPVG